MAAIPKITVKSYDTAGALTLRDQILAVYAASHADQIEKDPWFHPDRFWERLVELYAPGRGFSLVAGWLDNQVIGYAFGSLRDNLVQLERLWSDVRTRFPAVTIPDKPEPVYVFREFAVHPDHQRSGYGRTLHDHLLTERPERLADLLVRKDNVPAQAAYHSWGWRKLRDSQPFPDSPVFDELILPLPDALV